MTGRQTLSHVSFVLAPLSLLCFLALPLGVKSHGLMVFPNQRGTLQKWKLNQNAREVDPDAPIDWKPHFPAGDKDNAPGAAVRSQARAAEPEGWVPFTPLEKNFKWRAGVCGDEKGKTQDHMAGGKYYHGGMISSTYDQGGQLSIEVNIIAHHNGFFEFHLCDVAKCGGEISEDCFRQGHCRQLKRTMNTPCESRTNKGCAPVDPKYPGRWYLPCTTTWPAKNQLETFGGQTILYDLPAGWYGDHFVLQWFWAAANSCNPTGVIDFYDSDRSPQWGSCPGQSGAKGGVTRVQAPCSKAKPDEEYLQCADIRIVKKGSTGVGNPPRKSISPSKEPAPSAENPTRTAEPSSKPGRTDTATPSASPATKVDTAGTIRDGVITDIVLFADGKKIGSIHDRDVINIEKYRQIAIEAVTKKKVNTVTFYVDGSLVWTDYIQPYFMFGNKREVPNYWKKPIVNKKFKLTTVAEGDTDVVNITFKK